MRSIVVQKHFTDEEMVSQLGSYITYDDTWTYVDSNIQNVRISSEDGSIIAVIKRGAIPRNLTDLAVACYQKVGQMISTNRGHAAGLLRREKTHRMYEKGTSANTGVMGYIDNIGMKRPCRMTQFTKNHFQQYKKGIPFIQCIDDCFRETMPQHHKLQHDVARTNEFHIEETSFSTVTVNYNFRTALHKDSGDFRQGFGNLVVCKENVSGGEILFPQYKLAIDMSTGDFIAMDVHEFHCNAPIIQYPNSNGFRLSFVCYLRDRMIECNEVNAGIKLMDSENKTTSQIIEDIFCFLGETVPTKETIGYGKLGHMWWICKGKRITLTYKNKRYTLVDLDNNTKIHELTNAWKYAYDLHMGADFKRDTV